MMKLQHSLASAGYFTIFIFFLGLFLTPSVSAQVSGTVFRDFNGNGTKDTNEPLVAGITVNAYNTTGALCGTTTTSGSTAPNYTVTGTCAGQIRIEFVLPTSGVCVASNMDFAALSGSAHGTSVQFVSSTSSNINFAVMNPTDYNLGTTVTKAYIPCYVSGDPLPSGSASGAIDWFVGFPYTNSGTSTPPTQKINGAIIGATWGVAYSKQANKIFTSAFLKRHAGLGILGSGGIYMLEPTATSFNVTQFYNMDANGHRTRADASAPAYGEGTSYSIAADNGTITYLGTNDPLTGKPAGLGVVGTNIERGLSTGIEIPSYDPAAFDQIGKVGLGDIDISDDGKFLFVMNLYSRKVFRLELNNANNPTSVTNVTSYAIPATACTNGEYRPFGLKFYRNKLYVGVVCSGENGGTIANLNASVYELTNPTTSSTFNSSSLLSVPLNYNRTTDWASWTKNSGGSTDPAPILSDIEFTDNGDMTLSFMDRIGHQWGENNRKYLKTNTSSTSVSSDGDILIAGLNCSTGAFTLENNGTVTSANGSTLTASNSNGSQGPGGKEFFDDDSNSGDPHDETTFGAAAVLKGQGELFLVGFAMTTKSGDAGTIRLSTTNGSYVAGSAYNLYNRTDFNGIFAKANGLGDIELSGIEAPIEIGNRVFSDTDKDGIQDADELGIDGVTVKLFEGTTEVGTTITANGGQYYFTNANVTGGVKFNTAYQIRIASAQTPLSNLALTTADVASNGSDLIDSDGTISGANAVKTFTTGNAGENNHSYDFGFKVACQHITLGPVPLPSGTVGTPYSAQVTATGGTAPYQFLWYAGTMGAIPPGLSINSTGLVSGTPTAAGSYGVKIVVKDANVCPDSLDPAAITIAAGSVCSIGLTTNVSGCYDSNGNTAGGSSLATVQAIMDWSNNPSGETINVSCTGATAQSINPATASKPAILTFTVPANGAAVTVEASFSTTTTCTATQNVTTPTGSCIQTPCVAGNTGGTVWKDYNSDGVKDATTETQGLEGVTVKAYDCNNVLVGTAITDSKGQYTFGTLSPAPSATNKLRIEFSGGTPQYKPTFNGTNGRTDVQFISAATCNIDFGVNVPADYCQANPSIITPCYVEGAISATGINDVLVKWSYDNVGAGPDDKAVIANKSQIGSTWGIAYNRTAKKIYASALLKRHVGMGPNGIGAIYEVDPITGSPALFVDVTTLLGGAGSLGTVLSDAARGLTTPGAPSNDPSVYDDIYKKGLGDIDISDDDKTLYVTDLFNKQILVIDIATKTLKATLAVPSSACSGGSARPFGLKYYRGDVYSGVVCDAQTSQNAADLSATVYKFTGATGTPTSVISFPLDYKKGFAASNAYYGTGCEAKTGWYAWTNTFPATCSNLNVIYPQPILADIEFDVDGSMIMAFNDRFGHQAGYQNYALTGTTTFLSAVGGDILRASSTGNGQFIIENNGSLGGLTSASGVGNNQGMGGGEFYFGDRFAESGGTVGHAENVMGGMMLLPTKNEVAVIAFDPVDGGTLFSGGVEKLNNTNGSKNSGFNIFATSSSNLGTFGKANGLGDLEALCALAPIEIGNYIWYDQDRDGVQDPCEGPLSNVTLSLWKNGVQIATTTTDANGNYAFTGIGAPNETWTATAGTDSILPNMAYEVRIATNQGPLSMRELTTANATANNGNDQNDSDATLGAGFAVISFTTGGAGSTNHTLDFGFSPVCIPPTIMNVAATQATCTNGIANNNAEIHVTGIGNMVKYAYKTNATDSVWANTATTSTATSIDLTNLANPSVATTYIFRIWGTDTLCYNDTTVVLNPAVCPPCSITATFTQGACNNNSTTVITTDDFFTVVVSNVTSTNGGTSGKYEVILNGTVLNTGGTAYGTPVTVGGILDFKSDGATTYNLTVRDFDISTCVTTVFTTAASASCSAIGCKPMICLPVTVTKF